jgi:hypothetical protein
MMQNENHLWLRRSQHPSRRPQKPVVHTDKLFARSMGLSGPHLEFDPQECEKLDFRRTCAELESGAALANLSEIPVSAKQSAGVP